MPNKTKDSTAKFKQRGGVIGRALLHFLVKYLGKASIKLIMFPTVSYYILTQKKIRENAMKYWSTLYPGKSKIKYLIHIYKHYATFGKTLVDRIVNESTIHNEEADQAVLEEINKDQAVILLCSHIGGYNFFRFRFNKKIYIMMINEAHEKSKERFSLFDDMHTDKAEFINPMDQNSIFEAFNLLKNKETLAIMGDRVLNSDDKHVREKDILGLQRKFPLGPWHLAYSTDSVVICLFIIKKGNEYQLIAKPPIRLGHEIKKKKKEQIDQALQKYISYIEEVVKLYPDQWFNFIG